MHPVRSDSYLHTEPAFLAVLRSGIMFVVTSVVAGLTIRHIGDTWWALAPFGVLIGLVGRFIYLYWAVIYIPKNTGVVLLDETTGKTSSAGGAHSYGPRVKPVFKVAESKADFIDLKRRFQKDYKTRFVSADGVPMTAVWSGSYRPDQKHLDAFQSIDETAIRGGVEGAVSGHVAEVGASLDSRQSLKKTLFENKVVAKLEQEHKYQAISERWHVDDFVFNIESVSVSEDQRRVLESESQLKIIQQGALDLTAPKIIPARDSIQYKTLLHKARVEASRNRIQIVGEDAEDAAVAALLGLPYEKAFDRVLNVANQARQVNITGSGGRGTILNLGGGGGGGGGRRRRRR